MSNPCGTCQACCRVFDISQLNKKAGKWCQHCEIGSGCRIYENRPEACSTFQCLWLQSQPRPDLAKLPDELRPDRCKVVICATTDPNVVGVFTLSSSQKDAWKKKPVRELIDLLILQGRRIELREPGATNPLVIDAR